MLPAFAVLPPARYGGRRAARAEASDSLGCGVAQLRLALAQVNPTVGDLAGNAEHRPDLGRARPPRRRAPARCSPRCSSPATRSRTSRCARRSSRRPRRTVADAGAAARGRRARRPPRGRRLPRPARGRARRRRAAARLPAERRRGPARRARSSRATPSTTCRTTASSTSSATSSPAPSPCVVRVRGVDVALAICEDLWQDGGPVAEYAAPRARPAVVPNGSPYERNKDDVRLALVPATRRRGRLHAGLPQHGRRAGRAGLRRRLARRRRQRRGPRPRRRSSPKSSSLVDLDLPAADAAASRRRRGRSAEPVREPYEPLAAADGRAPQRRGRGLRRARPRAARLRQEERLPLAWSSGCPAASTRRSSRRSRATRSAARRVLRRLDAERVLLRALAVATPPSWRAAPACTSASMRDRRRWSRRSSTRSG